MKKIILVLLLQWLSFFLISCQTFSSKTTSNDQGKWIGLSHHFKLREEVPAAPTLEIYSPVEPFSLLQTVILKEEEAPKLKKIFTHMISLNGSEAIQYDEDLEALITLIQERNKQATSENEFEVSLAFEELIPQE